jgi:hypothetical protein
LLSGRPTALASGEGRGREHVVKQTVYIRSQETRESEWARVQ